MKPARRGGGSLSELVSFQRRDKFDDGMGNETSGPFETIFKDAAQLTPLRGGESVIAARLSGTQPYIVRVRSSTQTRQVTTDWRIVDARNDKRVFNITSITNQDERNQYLDIMAIEGVVT